MLFELINGAKQKMTHAGVLEFTAEEGRCYLPYWLMVRLSLEPGDLLQCKSTDLRPGQFIKLQPQSTNFLEISDPRGCPGNCLSGSFSCLTLGDVFTFSYNDEVFEIAVLEVKPDTEAHAISVQETDLEVDFAPPVGYEEEMAKKKAQGSGTSTPRSVGSAMAGKGGMMHTEGSMAQAINYSSIAPSSKYSRKRTSKCIIELLGLRQPAGSEEGQIVRRHTGINTPGSINTHTWRRYFWFATSSAISKDVEEAKRTATAQTATWQALLRIRDQASTQQGRRGGATREDALLG